MARTRRPGAPAAVDRPEQPAAADGSASAAVVASEPAATDGSAPAAVSSEPAATDASARAAVDAAVLEALELPLNGPRRFWLGFVFTDDPALAERARDLAAEIVRGRGRALELYRAAGADEVAPIARAVASRDPGESAVWVDWSAVSHRDRGEIERGLTMLNTGRSRLSRALRGGLVIAAPTWAEGALATGAVDLWSGSEFALRLRRERAADETAAAELVREPGRPQLWLRLAPTQVVRALRQEGAEVAAALAGEAAERSGPGDLARLEVVAAGLTFERGDREGAAERALGVAGGDAATPDVLAAAIEIAAAGAGDQSAARERWRPAIEALVAAVGDDDRDGLTAMDDLGEILRERGDSASAIALARRAVNARDRVLGAEHPDTLSTRNNLANARRSADAGRRRRTD